MSCAFGSVLQRKGAGRGRSLINKRLSSYLEQGFLLPERRKSAIMRYPSSEEGMSRGRERLRVPYLNNGHVSMNRGPEVMWISFLLSFCSS